MYWRPKNTQNLRRLFIHQLPGRMLANILPGRMHCLHELSPELWAWGTPDTSSLCFEWRWHLCTGYRDSTALAVSQVRLLQHQDGYLPAQEPFCSLVWRLHHWCHFSLVPWSKMSSDISSIASQPPLWRMLVPFLPASGISPPSQLKTSWIIIQVWLGHIL